MFLSRLQLGRLVPLRVILPALPLVYRELEGGDTVGGWVWQGGVGGLGDHHSVYSCGVVGVPVLLVDAGWGDVLV